MSGAKASSVDKSSSSNLDRTDFISELALDRVVSAVELKEFVRDLKVSSSSDAVFGDEGTCSEREEKSVLVGVVGRSSVSGAVESGFLGCTMLASTCGRIGCTNCKIHGGWRRKKAIEGHAGEKIEAEVWRTISAMLDVSFAPAGRLSPARSEKDRQIVTGRLDYAPSQKHEAPRLSSLLKEGDFCIAWVKEAPMASVGVPWWFRAITTCQCFANVLPMLAE